MEKLSVNGKSFDEIFEERGRVVQRSNLESGRVYFIDQSSRYEWNWIALIQKYNERGVFSCLLLGSDNDFEKHINQIMLASYSDVNCFYTATPNQIALLELYKSQCVK